MPVAQPAVVVKGACGRVVQRHLAPLVLLRSTDVQRAVLEVDIAAVKPERLAAAKALTASSPISVSNVAARNHGVNALDAPISAVISACE